jgi:ribosomal protein L1
MSGGGKRYERAAALAEREREHTPGEAIRALKAFPDARFDETVEIAFRLGVDPRKADQLVRGTVSLPNGSGQSVRVAVFAQGPKATEAKEAGADVVGGEELVEQVMGGSIDFDAAVATPDMMAAVGKAGRVLGPRGLMPNPKTGTVTNDIAKAVQDIKGGELPGGRRGDHPGASVQREGQVREDAHRLHDDGSRRPDRPEPDQGHRGGPADGVATLRSRELELRVAARARGEGMAPCADARVDLRTRARFSRRRSRTGPPRGVAPVAPPGRRDRDPVQPGRPAGRSQAGPEPERRFGAPIDDRVGR